MNAILLTALMMTVHDWTGQDEHIIDLEGHGREELFADVDSSRTVGWFTAIYPVTLRLSEPLNIGNSIKEIKEELRTIPHGGIGYGILRYLTKALGEPDQDQVNRITFNYLGQFDSALDSTIFSPATEMSGADISPENQRASRLEIIGCIIEGKLQIVFTYSKNRYHDETISKLTMKYLGHLSAIISFCTSGENNGYTPSDFEMVDLNQNQLDDLTEEVGSLLEDMDLDWDIDLEI
jgi:non-ribosomal peptide synthase protein (TIGR01720 family)